MSLLGSIAKKVGGIVNKIAPLTSMIPGPVGAISKGITIAGIGGAAIKTAAKLPAVLPRGLPAVLPGAGKIAGRIGGAITRTAARYPKLTRISKIAAEVAGYTVVGNLVYDAAGNVVARTGTRRINPLNHRALMRACRRIKASRKILKKVERACGVQHRAAPSRGRKSCR